MPGITDNGKLLWFKQRCYTATDDVLPKKIRTIKTVGSPRSGAVINVMTGDCLASDWMVRRVREYREGKMIGAWWEWTTPGRECCG